LYSIITLPENSFWLIILHLQLTELTWESKFMSCHLIGCWICIRESDWLSRLGWVLELISSASFTCSQGLLCIGKQTVCIVWKSPFFINSEREFGILKGFKDIQTFIVQKFVAWFYSVLHKDFVIPLFQLYTVTFMRCVLPQWTYYFGVGLYLFQRKQHFRKVRFF